MTTRVFVYGSLRRGERANGFLADAMFVGLARTVPGFTLYDLGAFPAMVQTGEGSVLGELYDVDDATLARLDRYEGHPHFYLRQPITLEHGGRAEAYLLQVDQVCGTAIVCEGDWRARTG
ncbi:MAG: gamma-glutamylcyclotransferase [Sandaracinaceae bacterium]|nr:gamma-glutamylcyclotransferase [Sandaracinaceae bacterium]